MVAKSFNHPQFVIGHTKLPHLISWVNFQQVVMFAPKIWVNIEQKYFKRLLNHPGNGDKSVNIM